MPKIEGRWLEVNPNTPVEALTFTIDITTTLQEAKRNEKQMHKLAYMHIYNNTDTHLSKKIASFCDFGPLIFYVYT